MTASMENLANQTANVLAFPSPAIEEDPAFFGAVLESIADGVYVVDTERRIVYWNQAAERLTGYPRDEVYGRRCADGILRHCDGNGSVLCETGCPLQATMDDGRNREAHVFLLHKEGHRVPVVVRSSPLRDRLGRIVGSIESFSDNRPRIAALDEIRELREKALVDPLTGVGNRRFIESRIRSLVAQDPAGGQPFAVMFVDIDHFKSINDRFGHQAGDAALRMVAKTLAAGLRSFDLVGRWGGEEFIVVALDSDPEALSRFAERLRSLVASAVLSLEDGTKLSLTCSIGGTVALGGERAEDVIDRADQLMYQSKTEGRNRVTIG